ncbi:NAD(P)/FAD-dependent oxidoreductase [Nocardioides ferulae]|uniref:NAD(P)/FAD-dependent oxidoreductase n=1 Tax=Nocardioides ferulae TaxID=2340821 RepID=UPI000EB03CCA|nr:NAD(P)/FAD-dependent oxidoreductase [Nocardioides ferulae]
MDEATTSRGAAGSGDGTAIRHDVVVVGGGPAGMQAALTLARMHRRVLLLDAGAGRNAATAAMHNFLTQDGRSPEEFRAAGRADLAKYPHVEVREVAAVDIAPDLPAEPREGAGFRVDLADGGPVRCRKLLLATGLRDELPDVPGLEELWGSLVLPCPYCDGHEQSGKHVAVLGEGPHAVRLALLMQRFTDRVTVLLGGGTLRDQDSATLESAGIPVRTQPVSEVVAAPAGARVVFGDGVDQVVEAIVLAAAATQAAPVAGRLGLDTVEGDCCVAVDGVGRTSLPGVYAAGDMARCSEAPLMEASVLAAAASGQLAATVCDLDLLSEDTGVAQVP